MVKPQKVELLSKIKDRFANTQLTVIADYRGLTVAEITDLRRKLDTESTKLAVVKNTFLRRISQDLGWEDLEPLFKGPTAVAYADTEAIAAIKVLHDFSKKHKDLEIKGGYLEGQVFSSEEVARLASLPTRDQLLSQFLSVLQAPMRNLLGVLQAPMRDVVGTLQAIADKKK